MNIASSNAASLAPLISATAIVIAGVVDDLRSRKFHNWLFIGCSVFAIAVAVASSGVAGLLWGTLGFTAGFAIMTPFVLMNVIGAGDMKLMAAFGIVAGWNAVLAVAILALFWGAVFGLVRTALRGQLKVIAHNMFAIVALRERKGLELQTMPFTVAILMGWLTNLVLAGVL